MLPNDLLDSQIFPEDTGARRIAPLSQGTPQYITRAYPPSFRALCELGLSVDPEFLQALLRSLASFIGHPQVEDDPLLEEICMAAGGTAGKSSVHWWMSCLGRVISYLDNSATRDRY